MFHFWFNTAFIDRKTGGTLSFTKRELDKAHKDKNDKLFDPQFRIELQFTTFEESAPIVSPQLSPVKAPDSARSSLVGRDEDDEEDEEDSFAYDVGDEEEEEEEEGKEEVANDG